ncbi:hypothetical protein WJX84_011433 [Apatococcus fuscideae]|uniref:RRM domain-containing protein n=1 Tax=Apatococcus fuscideae TaxID=2026836 RepID=A0AAW1T248_9CHLO
MAIVPQGEGDSDSESQYNSDNAEDDAENFPPGPVDPEHCLAGGPGFAGQFFTAGTLYLSCLQARLNFPTFPATCRGAAESPAHFYITAKDSRGTRIRDGGAYVVVTARAVGPGTSIPPVHGSVKDNKDGSYTATYIVPSRGNYELLVEINGSPIGGSPFPVFFSPPEPVTATPEAPPSPEKDGAGASTIVPTSLGLSQDQLARISASASALAAAPPTVSMMGSDAHGAGVQFPNDEDTLSRTLLVGNVSHQINSDQLKQLFGFCGSVRSCRLSGTNQHFALVEYGSSGEANAALGMNGMNVAGQQIKVEMAKIAREATPQGASNPYMALQMQQLHQYQLSALQSQSLAAQVANLRALQKSNPAAVLAPGVPQNSASQKAAALAAAAALSKKLGGLGGGSQFQPDVKPAAREHSPVRRPKSKSPSGKRRRPVSPTIRYRSERSRSPRRHSSRERRRSHSRLGRHRHSPDRRRGGSSPSRARQHRRDRSRSPRRRPSPSPGRDRRSRGSSHRGLSRQRDSSRRDRHDQDGRRDAQQRDRQEPSSRSHRASHQDRSRERRTDPVNKEKSREGRSPLPLSSPRKRERSEPAKVRDRGRRREASQSRDLPEPSSPAATSSPLDSSKPPAQQAATPTDPEQLREIALQVHGKQTSQAASEEFAKHQGRVVNHA